MRAAVPGLGTPYPIGGLLPAVFQEDPVAMSWTAGLDEVLAPAISTLDCIGAYVDPMLAPDDFVLWLAGWFGAEPDENWTARRRREAVARTVAVHRRAGTVAGLRELVELATGGTVEIDDGGGVVWASKPNTPPPGDRPAQLVVRVTRAKRRHQEKSALPADQAQAVRGIGADQDNDQGPDELDEKALDELVAAAKPAHIAHRVEVNRP